MLDLQFEQKHVEEHFRQIHGLEPEKRNSELRRTVHTMNTYLSGVYRESLYNPRLKGNEVLENLVQRAYIGNISNLVGEMASRTLRLNGLAKRKRLPKKDFSDTVKAYYGALSDLAGYLPAFEKLEHLGDLTEEQKRRIIFMDACGKLAVYSLNRLFSPQFQRSAFYLCIETKAMVKELQPIFLDGGIVIRLPLMRVEVQTGNDYVSNALLPLLLNARDHAFIPENNVYGRSPEEFFIDISGGPERFEGKLPAESGFYLVNVTDNGFGIRESTLPYIFENGFTTKPENGQHGVGLCAVKEFVESNGGTITVKSEEGKRTSFEFTIPYSRLEGFVCVQASP